MNDDGANAPLLSDIALEDIQAREDRQAVASSSSSSRNDNEIGNGSSGEADGALTSATASGSGSTSQPATVLPSAIPLHDRQNACGSLMASAVVGGSRFIIFAILWPAMYGELGRDVDDLLLFCTMYSMVSVPLLPTLSLAIATYGLPPNRMRVLSLGCMATSLVLMANAGSMLGLMGAHALLGAGCAGVEAAVAKLLPHIGPLSTTTLETTAGKYNESIGFKVPFVSSLFVIPPFFTFVTVGMFTSSTWRASLYIYAAATVVAALSAMVYPASALPPCAPAQMDGVVFWTETIGNSAVEKSHVVTMVERVGGPRLLSLFRGARLASSAFMLAGFLALTAMLSSQPLSWHWFLRLFFALGMIVARYFEPIFPFSLHTRNFSTWLRNGLYGASLALIMRFGSWLLPVLRAVQAQSSVDPEIKRAAKHPFEPPFAQHPLFWQRISFTLGTFMIVLVAALPQLRTRLVLVSGVVVTLCLGVSVATLFAAPAPAFTAAFMVAGLGQAVLAILAVVCSNWRAHLIGEDSDQRRAKALIPPVMHHARAWEAIITLASMGIATRILKYTLRHVPLLDPNSTLPAAASPLFPQYPKDVHDQIGAAMSWVFVYAGILAVAGFVVFVAGDMRPLGVWIGRDLDRMDAQATPEARAESGGGSDGGSGEVEDKLFTSVIA